MAIFQLDEHSPIVEDDVFIADSAQVIGKVQLCKNSSIWPGAVLRGDLSPIHVGVGSNIQDNAVIHTEDVIDCVIGDNVTVGHGAILHSCTVEEGALIGMGAIVLNGAHIGKDAIVGAGALVPEGKTVPDRALVVGCPARFVRELTDEEISQNHSNTAGYIESAKTFQHRLKRIG